MTEFQGLLQAGATAVSGSISDSLQTPKNRSGTAPALRTALSTSAPGASRGNSANQLRRSFRRRSSSMDRVPTASGRT
jgi:hypothetical protein